MALILIFNVSLLEIWKSSIWKSSNENICCIPHFYFLCIKKIKLKFWDTSYAKLEFQLLKKVSNISIKNKTT